jgi:hypothetical protein
MKFIVQDKGTKLRGAHQVHISSFGDSGNSHCHIASTIFHHRVLLSFRANVLTVISFAVAQAASRLRLNEVNGEIYIKGL